MKNRVTVIAGVNGTVMVDQAGILFSVTPVPENMRAIQWYGASGEVEFTDALNLVISGEEDYAKFVAPYVAAWEEEKARLDEEANRSPTQEEQLTALVAAIQAYLDQFAQTRNYDSILSATTYATSSVPKFRTEGQYAIEARDLVWIKLNEIFVDVFSAVRHMPTIEEVIAELPPLAWPEVSQ